MSQVPPLQIRIATLPWRITGARARIFLGSLCGCRKGGLIPTASPLTGPCNGKRGALVEDVKTSTNVSTDFILGNHLSKKKRTKILNGDYIDIFTLLPPTKMTGKGEKKRNYGKRRYRTPPGGTHFR